VRRQHILVVDDEDDVRRLLREQLERAGYGVLEAANGRDALRRVYEQSPDLVVLDIAMPELDGWHALERLRDVSDVPVLVLTARDRELEKVRALKGGADDYVVKPFGRQELLARVGALLRRPAEGRRARAPYADGALEIDFELREVRVGGQPVALTPLEFRLLAAFSAHPDQVLSHEQLLETVWGERSGTREEVRLYVGYVRKKIADAGLSDSPIETVRGFGYRFRPAATRPA
jgi:DNA-binding response OmpR family regulator